MPDDPPLNPPRRSFLTIAAASFVAVGGAAAVWPLVGHMAPTRGTRRETTFVDLEPIAEGTWIRLAFRGTPIYVRHRNIAEIEAARSFPIASLRDPLARVDGTDEKLPATDENRTKPGHARWLLIVGICPRENCIVEPRASGGEGPPDMAWFCPCGACRFDTSGRIFAGPSPQNLRIPLYRFVSQTRLEIGDA